MSICCISGFSWNGQPIGQESKLANLNTYVSGTNKDVAILIVHDVFGWTFTNTRLLADHYAKEVDATVYVPDFFDGEVVSPETLTNTDKQAKFDTLGFILGKHGKEKRFPEMEACAKSLRQDLAYKKVGAIGFCYGGWAVFQLGSKSKNPPFTLLVFE
ncbi:MAG: hypothetical protein Q9170_007974 [Blastenia crenularia]